MSHFYSPARPQRTPPFCARALARLALLVLLVVGGRAAWAQTLSSFSPTSGPAGTLVTITGADLDQVRSVRFGAGGLGLFTAQRAGSLTVRVPVDAASGALMLTPATGRAVVSPGAYTYAPRPAGLVATLSPAGPLDGCQPRTLTAAAARPAFTSGAGFNSDVRSVVVQVDGKVLVGGSFTTYQGNAATNLVRLNPDGSRDTSFAPGADTPIVLSMAVQADGQVLVGGSSISGRNPTNLVRLNPDGSRDPSFVTGRGFDGGVQRVAVQADGKLVVGGSFTAYQGAGAAGLIRLQADGSPDASFVTNEDFTTSNVTSVVGQADGKLLVGGSFTRFTTDHGPSVIHLLRLNADGRRDLSFVPSAGSTDALFNDLVRSVAVQADGKVLAGGDFTYDQGVANRLLRLNADGSRDASFATGEGFDGEVNSVVVQPDGKLLIGGSFTTYQGTSAIHLLRLNADGSRDTSFLVGQGIEGAVSTVFGVAVQADGRVLVGGRFATYQYQVAGNLLRLNADGSPHRVATPVSGASFTFTPGNTSTTALVTSTPGTYSVTARLDGDTSAPSNAVVLTACAGPTLSSFTPAIGPVGTRVTITGTNFAGTTAVAFNGTAASSFTVESATSLSATVAAGSTSGPLSVITRVGTDTSRTSFTVRPVPVANPDRYRTAYNTALGGNVLTNDTGTGLTVQLQSGVQHGRLQLNADGSFIYQPTGGYAGPDSFSYKACDCEADNAFYLYSDLATVSITVEAPSSTRLQSGGVGLATTRGFFAADQYYSVASLLGGTTAAIAGTPDPALYQQERYSTNGTLSYAVPVANGQYQVVLHFAELYWTQPGQRVFDGYLEGTKVLDHYDIVQKVGPLAAITESFPVTVTDGVLNLDLRVPYESGGADQAKLSALEIMPITPVYRLRVGGAALATTTHGAFAADQSYAPSSQVGGTTAAIASTLDPALYQQERYSTTGTLSYALPVANGQYAVVLHFAENYWTQPGQRVFDVYLEDSKVLGLYDIVKKVGPRTATTETFPVSVSDGVLNVDLRVPYLAGGADQAKLAALEVLQVGLSNAATNSVATLRATLPTAAAAAVGVAPATPTIYPNPSPGAFMLSYAAQTAQLATLLLLDPLGRIWHQHTVALQAGENQVAVRAPELPEGLYRLSLHLANGKSYSQQIAIRP